MVPIETAAARLGIPLPTVESWVADGLLNVIVQVPPSPAGTMGFLTQKRFVEEEQFHQLVESLGWLQLSGDSWDGPVKE